MHSGTRLGRYELVEPLGEGASGTVWKAVLTGPGGFRKHVALKVLRPDRTHAFHRASLVAEARLGALLAHPNVVVVLDSGEDGGTWYVAMEWVQGLSLAEVLRAGPLAGDAVLDVGLQVAQGLAEIHALGVGGAVLPASDARIPVGERDTRIFGQAEEEHTFGRRPGVVHRDIKPANLLLERTGLVKVADLGLARLSGSAAPRGGTLGYVAPEQLLGTEDPRADLYALGATLFELATGALPLEGAEDGLLAAFRIDRRTGERGFFDPVEARVPGLGAVLRRCLRSDPEERFATAGDLAEALAALRPLQPAGERLVDLVARLRPGLVTAPTRGTTRSSASLGNLPPERDRFVGRDVEVAELAAAIRAHRLVTVHGPGGAGKTRTAIAAVRHARPHHPGGAWFVDLSDAATPETAVGLVARALSVDLGPADPVAQVGRALRALGPAVVVLDNLEQLVEHAAALLAPWLEAAPELRLVVTSRVLLRLSTETRWPLGPLGAADGLALFAARLGRTIEPHEVEDATALVAVTEGLPLAIELAAARARGRPIAEVRARSGQLLRLLAGGDRDRPERQRSLRAALDGSHELLTPAARVALAQLSVFEGGFTVEAAEGVLDLSAFPEAGWALDLVRELSEASLVRTEPGTDRLGLLVVVQEYAAERLLVLDPDRRTERRHGAWFARMGTPAALRAQVGVDGVAQVRRVTIELGNLTAAARRASARGEAEVARATLTAAWRVLSYRGPLAYAAELMRAALAAGPLEPAGEADLRRLLGSSLRVLGQVAGSRAELDRALALAEATGDRALRLRVHIALANLHSDLQVPADAARHAELAFELSRAGDLLERARGWDVLSSVRMLEGRKADAVELLEQAMALYRQLGDGALEVDALGRLGLFRLEAGRPPAEAEALLREAVDLSVELENPRTQAVTMLNLGLLQLRTGRNDEARVQFELARRMSRDLGNRGGEATAIGNLAVAALNLGRLEEARELLLRALALHREMGARRTAANVLANLGVLEQRLGNLAGARRVQAETLALALELGDERLRGQTLGNLARIDEQEGHHERALAGYTEAIAVDLGCDNQRSEVFARSQRAGLYLALGRHDEAEADATRALELARRSGDRPREAQLQVGRAEVLRRAGRGSQARAELDAAEALVREFGAVTLVAWLAERAEHAIDARALAEAEAALAEADRLPRDPADPADPAGREALDRARARLRGASGAR